MKIFTDPWSVVFDWLPAWSRLSRETREFFARQIPGDLRVPNSLFDPACVAELKQVGFIKGESPRLSSELRPFRRAIRAMDRHRVFDEEQPRMRDFVEEHLTQNEAQTLLDYSFYRNNHWKEAETLASDETWLRGFLDAQLGAKWEQEHTNQVRDTWLAKVKAVELLKDWIRRCLEGDGFVPLADILVEHEREPEMVSDALTAGVRYLLLFPALHSETLDPVIGVWPAIHRRWNRKALELPVMADCPPVDDLFATPYLSHDMTMTLVNSAPDGLRLRRSGGGLFKREVDKLVALLSPIRDDLGLYTDGSHRVYEACAWLESMELFKVKGERGKEPTLVATPTGKEWLAQPIELRLQSLLDVMRKAYSDRKERYMEYTRSRMRFTSRDVSTGGWGYDHTLDPQRHLVEAFERCEAGKWMALDAFLDWAQQEANPLLRNVEGKRSLYGRFIQQTADEKEASWRRYLEGFLRERLMPLGGAQVCVDASGQMHFALTSAGMYLLGQADTLEYEDEESVGQVLVQPNFEIVFTAPAPAVEAELSQFAERIGHGVGTLFRITRQSIHGAFDYGLDGDSILERLRRHTHKALSANVQTQITDWANAYRRVGFRRMLTLRCPDPETAKHVQSIFPRLVRPVTETLLEVTSQKSVKDMKKRLRKQGIGVE